MKSNVFARARKETVAAILLAAGSSALVACSSSDANYRPAPNYTQPVTVTRPAPSPAPAPTYSAPAQPQVAQPVAPVPSKGQFACGKGKCG